MMVLSTAAPCVDVVHFPSNQHDLRRKSAQLNIATREAIAPVEGLASLNRDAPGDGSLPALTGTEQDSGAHPDVCLRDVSIRLPAEQVRAAPRSAALALDTLHTVDETGVPAARRSG